MLEQEKALPKQLQEKRNNVLQGVLLIMAKQPTQTRIRRKEKKERN